MKLIFCDLNKSLVDKVATLFKEFKTNKWNLELEAIHSDIFEIHKQYGGKIVTASNPHFTFGGGLDAQIKKNFPNEVINNIEFEITDNLFKTITVDLNIQCDKKILQRALIGVFGYRKQQMIISGLGTAIGGLSEDDFISVLKYVLSANLRSANLSYANLRSANLRSANLSYANLRSANLSSANLNSANLSYADLNSADLRYAKNLDKVKINEGTCFFALQCPEEGAFTAWKKCEHNTIVKLLIPEKAKRSSATSRKCRASEAKVLAIYTQEGKEIKETKSSYDKNFIYKVGKVVKVDNFNEDRWEECSTGIHFFITRIEAENYN